MILVRVAHEQGIGCPTNHIKFRQGITPILFGMGAAIKQYVLATNGKLETARSNFPTAAQYAEFNRLS